MMKYGRYLLEPGMFMRAVYSTTEQRLSEVKAMYTLIDGRYLLVLGIFVV